MLLGNLEFDLIKPSYEAELDDSFVCCYLWGWVEELICNGFDFKTVWDPPSNVVAVPIDVYRAAKAYHEGYADMTLTEFVQKTISK